MNHILKIIYPITCVLIVGFTSNAQAAKTTPTATQLLEKELKSITGTVNFLATGKPSAIKIHGQGTGLTGRLILKENILTGHLEFPIDQLDTGIDLRNEHMKEKYLESKTFKTASIDMSPIQLVDDISKETIAIKDQTFNGTLTLHGVVKPITGKFSAENIKQNIKSKAEFDLKITDYGIKIPSYLGITVAETVHVVVELQAETK